MKTLFNGIIPLFCLLLGASAFGQPGANYSNTPVSFDAGGTTIRSANYTINASASPVAGSNQASVNYVAMDGWPGQLYNAVALQLTPSPATINVAGTSQIAGTATLDDGSVTVLPGTSINWNSVSGPVASISASGVVTGGTESVDSSAVVEGSWLGVSNTTTLIVLNGNYGTYGSAGIPDTWQVQYFGLNNSLAAPGADADGTGQTNLFKYIAGLDPTNTNSRFAVAIGPVAGQPGVMTITFSPVATGRTYTVQYCTDLGSANWQPLTGATESTSGNSIIVTDPNATGPRKFYHVQISY